MSGDFVLQIDTIREQARVHMDQGPITSAYGADRERVIKVLNEVLATEIVCVLRYMRHYYMADGIQGETVKAEFLENANEERSHADRAARRITTRITPPRSGQPRSARNVKRLRRPRSCRMGDTIFIIDDASISWRPCAASCRTASGYGTR